MKSTFIVLAFLVLCSFADPDPDNFCRLTKGVSEKKVLILGLDGLGSLYLQKDYMPYLWKEVVEKGSWTLDSRNVRETSSKPNWGSLLMGAGPEHTSILDNSWKQPSDNEFRPTEEFIPSVRKGKVFPNIFSEMKKENSSLTTLSCTDHDVVVNLVDDYEEDIDAFAYFEADVEGLLNWFNSCISDAQDVPDLAFVHFDLIDHGGHLFGWGSNGYRRGLKEADEHIETLLNMYHSRNVFENTLIVVVSDHGGTNLGHGNDHLTDLLVPVFFKGPGVAIQHLQTEIQNIHVAPTILHFLGITPPKYWTGRVLTEIFNPSENVNPGITMYGAEDWCGKLQKCSDIAGTDCGWCEDQGKAMLGSSLRGPFKDDCKDWIWNSSDCENSKRDSRTQE